MVQSRITSNVGDTVLRIYRTALNLVHLAVDILLVLWGLTP